MSATATPARHDPVLLSADGVAQILDTTPLVVKRLARDGKFPSPIRLNRKVARWHRQTVLDWADKQAGRPQLAHAR
jgi:predicted DNA-binding transcriptional regulator AlpA